MTKKRYRLVKNNKLINQLTHVCIDLRYKYDQPTSRDKESLEPLFDQYLIGDRAFSIDISHLDIAYILNEMGVLANEDNIQPYLTKTFVDVYQMYAKELLYQMIEKTYK